MSVTTQIHDYRYLGPPGLEDYHRLLLDYRSWEQTLVRASHTGQPLVDPSVQEVADHRYAQLTAAWYAASEERRAEYVALGLAGAVDAMQVVRPTELQPLSKTFAAPSKTTKRGKRR